MAYASYISLQRSLAIKEATGVEVPASVIPAGAFSLSSFSFRDPATNTIRHFSQEEINKINEKYREIEAHTKKYSEARKGQNVNKVIIERPEGSYSLSYTGSRQTPRSTKFMQSQGGVPQRQHEQTSQSRASYLAEKRKTAKIERFRITRQQAQQHRTTPRKQVQVYYKSNQKESDKKRIYEEFKNLNRLQQQKNISASLKQKLQQRLAIFKKYYASRKQQPTKQQQPKTKKTKFSAISPIKNMNPDFKQSIKKSEISKTPLRDYAKYLRDKPLRKAAIWLDKKSYQAKGLSKGAVMFVAGVGTSLIETAQFGISIATEPKRTFKQLKSAVTHPMETGYKIGRKIKTTPPAKLSGEIAGDVLVGYPLGKVASKAIKTIKYSSRPLSTGTIKYSTQFLEGDKSLILSKSESQILLKKHRFSKEKVAYSVEAEEIAISDKTKDVTKSLSEFVIKKPSGEKIQTGRTATKQKGANIASVTKLKGQEPYFYGGVEKKINKKSVATFTAEVKNGKYKPSSADISTYNILVEEGNVRRIKSVSAGIKGRKIENLGKINYQPKKYNNKQFSDVKTIISSKEKFSSRIKQMKKDMKESSLLQQKYLEPKLISDSPTIKASIKEITKTRTTTKNVPFPYITPKQSKPFISTKPKQRTTVFEKQRFITKPKINQSPFEIIRIAHQQRQKPKSISKMKTSSFLRERSISSLNQINNVMSRQSQSPKIKQMTTQKIIAQTALTTKTKPITPSFPSSLFVQSPSFTPKPFFKPPKDKLKGFFKQPKVMKTKVKSKKKYTPTAYAAGLGIFGSESMKQAISGLTLRPIKIKVGGRS